jgi:hypothetical protein
LEMRMDNSRAISCSSISSTEIVLRKSRYISHPTAWADYLTRSQSLCDS